MKHGRRHDKLKEQAYIARKNAEGYGRPYRPIDVAEPTSAPAEAPPTDAKLGLTLRKKTQRQLRRLGIDPATDEEDEDAS